MRLIRISIEYMDLYIKPIKMDGKLLGMGGKWLGNIQPMCSAPGAFPPGAFFRQKSAPFPKKCLFGCFYNKTSLFIIKRPDPMIKQFCLPWQSTF